MRSGSNPNIDDDTRKRALKFVESANSPKPSVAANPPTKKTPIVTKKMLADSGFDNLRDYMNAQRGLTRRKEVDPTAGEARDRAAQEAADAMDGADPKYGLGLKSAPKTAESEVIKYEEPPVQTTQPAVSETKKQKRPRNLTDFLGITTPYKSGGSVKRHDAGSGASNRGDGIARRGTTKGRFV